MTKTTPSRPSVHAAVRTALLSARLPPKKLEAYQAAAKADGRTLTSWIEWNLDVAAKLRPVPGKAR